MASLSVRNASGIGLHWVISVSQEFELDKIAEHPSGNDESTTLRKGNRKRHQAVWLSAMAGAQAPEPRAMPTRGEYGRPPAAVRLERLQ